MFTVLQLVLYKSFIFEKYLMMSYNLAICPINLIFFSVYMLLNKINKKFVLYR